MEPLDEILRRAVHDNGRPMSQQTESSASVPSGASLLEIDSDLMRERQREYRRRYLDLRSLDERRRALTTMCQFCGAAIPPREGSIMGRVFLVRQRCECPEAIEDRRQAEIQEQEKLKASRRAQLANELHRRYEYSGLVALGLMEKTFAAFDGRRQPEAYRRAMEFARDVRGLSALVLSGPFGSGKTHLAVAILHYWITERWNGGKFYGAARLWSRIRSTYGGFDGEGEYEVYEELAAAPLVVVDDVGRRHTNTPAARDFYDRIIDARYSAGRPLVLTTNLTMDELPEWITWAGFSRLAEMVKRGGWVDMQKGDYRLE